MAPSFLTKSALVLPLMLASVALVPTSGCSDIDAAESYDAPTVFRTIDAETINSLEPGENFVVERQDYTSWTFDGSKGPIDYSRITIVCPGNVRMPMTAWFEVLGAAPEDGHTGSWTLASDPRNFGTLDSEQQQMLREHLEYLKEQEDEGFRAFDQQFDIDGTTYWVCTADNQYACEGDSNLYPL